ncbi:unnamed protein product [Ixodes pacificus]
MNVTMRASCEPIKEQMSDAEKSVQNRDAPPPAR